MHAAAVCDSREWLIAKIYLFFCVGTHELTRVCNYVGMWLCRNFLPLTVIMALEVKEGSAECLQVLMSEVVKKREGMNYGR